MDNDTDVDKAQFHQIIVNDRAGGRLLLKRNGLRKMKPLH